MDNIISILTKFSSLFLSQNTVCFDLGTTNTRVAIKGKGIVLDEPSFIAYSKRQKDYIFFGQEAKEIAGKVPIYLKVFQPLKSGVIFDFNSETALLKKFLYRSLSPYSTGRKFLKPQIRAITNVPYIATEIEQKAVSESLNKIGISQVNLIEKSVANAIGCGINILSHKPTLIVDMGGGLIETAIISGGGIINQKTLKTAGQHMDKIIYNYVYLKHGLILGKYTCEKVKLDLLNFAGQEKTATFRGKSLETGLPKSVRIKSSEIKEALIPFFNQIIDSVKEILEISQPEIINDLLKKEVILTGGLANIPGLDNFFKHELKMNIKTAEKPQLATTEGLLKLSENEKLLEIVKV